MRRRPRGAALALVAGLLLCAAPARAAGAGTGESAAQARAEAAAAAAKVTALEPRLHRALRAYDRALAQISGAVARSVAAQQQADASASLAVAHRNEVTGQVRALYMAGGSAALVASILTATTASDAMRRVAYVQRLVATTAVVADDSSSTASDDAVVATRLGAVADHHVVTASDVMRRYRRVTATIAKAAAVLAKLSDRARRLTAAEQAAAALQAAAGAVSAAAAQRVADAKAMPIPADFKKLYVGAAKTCPGLSWTVLGAIGQVESGHGRNPSTSYAGAQGPMQFLPSTFAAYAVDGDHDGDRDIMDPADAIYTAAHYLCANGAGHGESGLHNAIWHYNHAEWYVALVLKLAGQLATGASPTGPTIGG